MTDNLVRAFVRDFVRDPQTFSAEVHPNDEMLLWNRAREGRLSSDPRADYLITGQRMLNDLRRVVRWAGGEFGHIGAMLDFAGGYGRLTRFLVQELPCDRIWISDIQEEAVRFQVETFGVHGFLSAGSAENLICDQRFDLIFVASLFSHLPDRTFRPWLQRLYELLTDRGVLVFSVHDLALAPQGSRHRAISRVRGISFAARSESQRLDPKNYGTSFVSENYVERAICAATGRQDLHRRIPKGLCDYQDLYVVTREPRAELAALDTSRGLLGYVENRQRSERGVQVGGWAHDFSNGASTTEVVALVNGRVADRTRASGERADVAAHFEDPDAVACGWSLSVDGRGMRPDDVMALKATSDAGNELLLLLETWSHAAEDEIRR